MAGGDKKYSELDSSSTLTGNETFSHLQVGKNVKSTLSKIYTYFKSLFDSVYSFFTGNYDSGFDSTDVDSMGTPSWDDATLTYSIAVKSGESSFWYWVKSVKITHTTTQSVTIPDVTGTYYFYFDDSGVMQYILESNLTSVMFYEYAICGGVYWNSTEATGVPWEERHGKSMSPSTHLYNHSTTGARYGNGLDPTGFVSGNTTYTNVLSGSFWDEDIYHAVASATTHSFIYREGANGDWIFTTASNEHAYKEGGDTYYSWNEYTGSTWQLTEGGNQTDFFIMFWLAAPTLGGATVAKMVSQSAYSNANSARNAIESELSNIKTSGLPSPEFIFIYATIIKRDGELQIVEGTSTYYDLRSIKGSVAGNTTPSHNELDGLELAESGVTYGHIDDQSQEIAGTKSFSDGVNGGTASGDDLTLESTSDSTKGYVIIQPNGGAVGINDTAPSGALTVKQLSGATNPFVIKNTSGNIRINTSLANDDADIFLYDRNDILQTALRSEGVSYFNGSNIIIGDTSGDEKLTVIGAVSATLGFYSPYIALTVTSGAATYSLITGQNRTATITEATTITFTNMSSALGLTGTIRLNVTTSSTVTLAGSGVTFSGVGNLTSLPIGVYHLAFTVISATQIDYNINSTPYE